MSNTGLVTKAEALSMLSEHLRGVQPPDVMHKLLDLYAAIAGWNKLVRKHLKRQRPSK